MAPATSSLATDPALPTAGASLRDRGKPLWRFSLTRRILAVNLLTLALLAGGFFYLNNYRSRLVDARLHEITGALTLLDSALAASAPGHTARLVNDFAAELGARVRIYDAAGRKTADSFWAYAKPPALPDPRRDPWPLKAARILDRIVDFVAAAPQPQRYAEPAIDRAEAWPEIRAARPGRPTQQFRFAPDRTPMLSAALPRQKTGGWLLVTLNAREVTQTVRDERWRFALVLLLVGLAGALLSLFLGRTIVRPLRRLAMAAIRVRLGRSRDVTVPRLPARRDEIGLLARALSDMSQALRQRIDAGEAFAADVTHELKNPLASLRSAIDTLAHVDEPKLRAQLLQIAASDVQRLSRLVTEIGEASRMDAELSKTQFRPVELARLVADFAAARSLRQSEEAAIALRVQQQPLWVVGDPGRLERVLVNLVDNAASFAGPNGHIWLTAGMEGDDVLIRVEDDGPGVPPQQRERIFTRFHSDRPDSEAFGQHSGLGLAIVRTIIDAHEGSVAATERPNHAQGACFEIRLPGIDPAFALSAPLSG